MDSSLFGSTNRTVSRLGFGGAPAGLTNYLGDYDASNTDHRHMVGAAIERALEVGITYFDTAASYGRGASEQIFGDALAGADIFLATKVSVGDFGNIRASLERSLKNLKRDHVDLLQLHGSTYSDDLCNSILTEGGAADQLQVLKEEGLIRFSGFTTEDTNGSVTRQIRSGRFDAMQICYNFMYQHPYEPTRPFGTIPEAQEGGMGVVTMRTVTSGIFQKFIQAANPANTFDYTPSLLQYVLSNPAVNVALVGMRTVKEVEQNAAIVADTDGRFSLKDIHERYVGPRAK